jgi:hypothetical protein
MWQCSKRRNIKMKEEQEEKKCPKKLGEMLIYYKIITPEQLVEGLKIQKNMEKRIGEVLIDLGRVTQDEINWVLGRQLNIPYVQINVVNIDIQLSKNISENVLKKFKAKKVTKRKIKIVFASFENIDETIDQIFHNKNR